MKTLYQHTPFILATLLLHAAAVLWLHDAQRSAIPPIAPTMVFVNVPAIVPPIVDKPSRPVIEQPRPPKASMATPKQAVVMPAPTLKPAPSNPEPKSATKPKAKPEVKPLQTPAAPIVSVPHPSMPTPLAPTPVVKPAPSTPSNQAAPVEAPSPATPAPEPKQSPPAKIEPIKADEIKAETSKTSPKGETSEASFSANYLSNPKPDYPAEARENGEEGTVMLRAVINPEGNPIQVKISKSSGSQALDHAALVAVKRWRFVPAKKEGIAVEGTVIIPLSFHIKDF